MPSERLYLDVFGGQPENLDRLTLEQLQGSPRIALNVSDAPFTRLRFFELEPYASRLESSLRESHPRRDFQVIAGDCNVTIHGALDQLTSYNWWPTFAFVDPT